MSNNKDYKGDENSKILENTNPNIVMSKRDIALMLLTNFRDNAKAGIIILGIWRDLEHFNKWQTLSGKLDDSVRVAILKSDLIPMLVVPNKENVAICGIALGREVDYSDTNLIYWISVEPS